MGFRIIALYTVILMFTNIHFSMLAKTEQKKKKCGCPFGVSVCEKSSLTKQKGERLFPGLFVNKTQLQDDLQNPRKAGRIIEFKILQSSKSNIRRRSILLDKSDVLLRRAKRQSNCYCCQTHIHYIAPLLIEYEGINYNVTQYDDSYQVLAVGHCLTPTPYTVSFCVEEVRLHWILVDDPGCSWDPKVRFVPLSYPNHCSCVSAGR